MKNKFLFVGGIFFVISFFLISRTHEARLREDILIEAFNSSKAKLVTSEVHFWSKIKVDGKDTLKVKLLMSDVLKTLGIKDAGALETSYVKNDRLEKTVVNCIAEDKSLVNINFDIYKKDGLEPQKTISISVTEDLESLRLKDKVKELKKVLKKHKIKPKVNYCLVGSIEGKLDNSMLEEVAEDVFKKVCAKKVEGMRDKKVVSVSGYTPHMGNTIRVNGKKVNLNLAIRYNSYEDKTYLWFATPIITTEY